MNIAATRLASQHIPQADFATAKDVVFWMGAMQAQDYAGALWSIALRTPDLTRTDVEQAIDDRQIVRTWPMRGTLHFLAAEDARWMTRLLAPRAIAAAASRRRQLEIDDAVLAKAKEVIVKALEGGHCLTRNELCARLDAAGIPTVGQRGIHLLHYWAEMTLICFGPHDGKQPTFVLMDEWLPKTPEKDREEALKELARRYFTSHGPASMRDFAGWANLTLSDARRGAELADDLVSEEFDGIRYWFNPTTPATKSASYLLPGFDEYILGYKNRSAMLAPEFSDRIVPGNNGMFMPTIVIDSQVAGTWKRTARTKSQQLQLMPFKPLNSRQIASLKAPIERFERYSGLATNWEITS